MQKVNTQAVFYCTHQSTKSCLVLNNSSLAQRLHLKGVSSDPSWRPPNLQLPSSQRDYFHHSRRVACQVSNTRCAWTRECCCPWVWSYLHRRHGLAYEGKPSTQGINTTFLFNGMETNNIYFVPIILNSRMEVHLRRSGHLHMMWAKFVIQNHLCKLISWYLSFFLLISFTSFKRIGTWMEISWSCILSLDIAMN